ncbi:hypothetical protein BS78_04G155000 [Paspalum vaginatum]|nr:hypothetical protein BS78_04G155000 [Paspalum vaginatum]
MLASDSGIGPVKLLFLRRSTWSSVSLSPRSAGTRPLRLLASMNICSMDTHELRLPGISPEKALYPRSSALNPRSSARRNVRFPMAAESVPASPLIGRSSPTARGGLLPLNLDGDILLHNNI